MLSLVLLINQALARHIPRGNSMEIEDTLHVCNVIHMYYLSWQSIVICT